jgi:hypothetical protein
MRPPIFTQLIIVGALALSGCDVSRSHQEHYKRGKELFEHKKIKAAYRHFKKAALLSPDSAHYHWAAAQTAPTQNGAYLHNRSAWEHGARNLVVLQQLAQLSFHTEASKKLAFALELYNQLPDSLKNPWILSNLHEQYQSFDSSLAIRLRLYTQSPRPTHGAAIARLYLGLHRRQEALDFLESCRIKKQLDAPAYIMLASLYAEEYQQTEIEPLFEEARGLKQYDGKLQLSHAGFLASNGSFKAAQSLLAPLLTPRDSSLYNLARQARIMQAYIASLQKDSSSLDQLIPLASSAQERYYIGLLRQNLTDTTPILKPLLDSYKALQPNATIGLIVARHYALSGAPKKALPFYKNLPALIVHAPSILVEYATVLSLAGENKAALQLIATMHSKKLVTRRSLEFFRDLTFKLNLLDNSAAAQRLLEQKYSDDVSIRWSGAILALQSGHEETALQTFRQLARLYPEEERFTMAILSTYLLQNKPQTLLDESKNSPFGGAGLHTLRARAARKLNNDSLALQSYRAAITPQSSPQLLMEFANYLNNKKLLAEATQVYEQIRTIHLSSVANDSSLQGIVLNNLAWSQLQSGDVAIAEIVSTAQQAYLFLPHNLNVLDTYAEVLARSANYTKLIEVLENNPLTQSEPRLLFHLGGAYEKKGQTNKAVRTFQYLVTKLDSTYQLPLTFGRTKISAHIQNLIDP